MKKIFSFSLLVLSLGIVKFTWTLNIDVTKEPYKEKIANQAEIANVGKTILLKHMINGVKQVSNDSESMDPRGLEEVFDKILFQLTAYLIKKNHQRDFPCSVCGNQITTDQKWINYDCENTQDGFFHPCKAVHATCQFTECECGKDVKRHSSLNANLVE